MNDLETIRLFLFVAEESSFSAAARRLGVSPAVATRRIAALEQALSVRLFTRSTRQVALTQEGWLFHEHALQIVGAADLALEAMQARTARPEGRVRVLCRAGVARQIITPSLHAFRQRHPAVTLGIQLTEQRTLSLVESGCDVGITIGQLDDSSLVQRRLVETDSHLFASPDYLARRGTPAHPRELESHDCMTLNAATGSAVWRFSRGDERFSLRVAASIAIDDPDSLLRAATDGLGVIMLADWSARDAVAAGALVRILPDFQIEPRGTPITALYPSRMYVPLKVRAFVDFLAEVCATRFGTVPAQR